MAGNAYYTWTDFSLPDVRSVPYTLHPYEYVCIYITVYIRMNTYIHISPYIYVCVRMYTSPYIYTVSYTLIGIGAFQPLTGIPRLTLWVCSRAYRSPLRKLPWEPSAADPQGKYYTWSDFSLPDVRSVPCRTLRFDLPCP